MGKDAIGGIVAVLIAIVGVAIISLLVSQGAQTSSVLSALSQGISRMICVATSPVSGGGCGGTSVTSTISY